MNTAVRIRSQRIALGLSEVGVAKELGLSIYEYGDLEQHDDELATCISLEQAVKLANRLRTPLIELLAECATGNAMPEPEQVARSVAAYLSEAKLSVVEFEEIAGWEVRKFLEEPVREAPSLPIVFFQELAKVMGVPSLSLVPRVHVA